MIKLNDLLNENFCSENLGKILFQKFSHFYTKNKNEKDTDYEKRVYDKLKEFIRGEFNNKAKDAEFVKIISNLMKCKREIPQALQPQNESLYRGSFATTEIFWDYFSKNVNIFGLSERPIIREVKVPYIYKPQSILQSWTSDKTVAENFMVKQRNSKGFSYGFPIIYKINKPSKDFIFNDDFLNLFAFMESEVIRMGGPLKVDSILYYPSDIRNFMLSNNIKK